MKRVTRRITLTGPTLLRCPSESMQISPEADQTLTLYTFVDVSLVEAATSASDRKSVDIYDTETLAILPVENDEAITNNVDCGLASIVLEEGGIQQVGDIIPGTWFMFCVHDYEEYVINVLL